MPDNLPHLSDEDKEHRRYDELRRQLLAFERWNMLPEKKRMWFGGLTDEDMHALDSLIILAPQIPEITKAIRLARSAETAGKFWKKGIMAFLGGVLVFGPGMKMLLEIWEYFAAFFRKAGGP